MWININGEQYVRLEDVVEAITNALDGLSPKRKARPSSELKQVKGQLSLLDIPKNMPEETNNPVIPGPLGCEAADFVPRNGKKLPRDEYMAERERVYQAIVSRVGVGVKLSRKEIASIAGVGYDVARIHIRSLIVAGRINKDDIIAVARPTKK
jgi:hypothetical protein